MAYIYKITNKSNGKVYIGKTESSVEKRWSEHCKDSVRKSLEKRPLYNAINKHGKENFIVEMIEETDVPTEREIYWINFYNSYLGEGYNATAGGDGKKLILYSDNEIIEKYLELHTILDVATELGIGTDYVSGVLEKNNIKKFDSVEVKIKYFKPVLQIDKKTGEIIKEHSSIRSAERELANGKPEGKHINQVAQGKRKTAYGFKWEYKI